MRKRLAVKTVGPLNYKHGTTSPGYKISIYLNFVENCPVSQSHKANNFTLAVAVWITFVFFYEIPYNENKDEESVVDKRKSKIWSVIFYNLLLKN